VISSDTLALATSPLGDEAFQVLLVSIGLLILCTVGFVGASVLLRIRNNRIARQWARLEARWDPVMLEVLSGAAPIDALEALVPREDARRFVEYLMRYARRIRGTERVLITGLAGPHLYTVSGDLTNGNVERRARAAQMLGELGPVRYRTELLAALKDPAPVVVMIAAKALSRECRPEDAPPLIESVSRLSLLTGRLLVAMLQRLGPQAAGAFRQTLADPTQPAKLRAVAAKVLAGFNDQAAADIAAAVVDQTEDVDLRVAALQVIEQVGTADHLPLARRLTTDPEPAVRGSAIKILGKQGAEADVPLLVDALEDPVSWVAIHAAEGLRRGGRAVLEAVAEVRRRRSSVVAREMLFKEDQ
jgi:HEAT repeat protein